MRFVSRVCLGLACAFLGSNGSARGAEAPPASLLHASFDLSRELCQDLNSQFSRLYNAKSGRTVRVYQSHAGSSKQARAVLEGLPADVLTLNVALDMDMLAQQSDLIAPNWRTRFPWGASPCSSTIVFLVRAGNPRRIRDWPNLVERGCAVIVPHPKTSGNGRYGYLAALAFVQSLGDRDPRRAKEFLMSLYRNVPILEGGGRSATMTFIQRRIGDALVTLEAEALQVVREHPGAFEVIRPSCSIEVEIVAAVVEPVARRRHSLGLAENYLDYLFTPSGQELLCRHDYRPRLPEVAQAHAGAFPKMRTFTVEGLCGSWERAQATHFAEGAWFDQIMASLR